jgi:hypothetical protein
MIIFWSCPLFNYKGCVEGDEAGNTDRRLRVSHIGFWGTLVDESGTFPGINRRRVIARTLFLNAVWCHCPLSSRFFGLHHRPLHRKISDKQASKHRTFSIRMAELNPIATFVVEGRPDWMAIIDDAVWVASSNVNHVIRLNAKTNQPGTVVTVANPCSGLAFGFGSLWIPSCGDHNLVRVDAKQARLRPGSLQVQPTMKVALQLVLTVSES